MRISRFILGLAVVQRMLSETGWRPLRLTTLSRAILESVVSGVKPDVRLRVADSSIEVTCRAADRIAVVLSELALNSLRHCGDRNVVEIDVRLWASEGQVVLEYRDSGPGYPERVLCEQPLLGGLALISELARQGLEGSIALSNAPGAMATLTFSASGRARLASSAAASSAGSSGTAWAGASSGQGSCNGGLQ
jgi:two-component sensor histidine kinase